MGKKTRSTKQSVLFPEVDEIISLLNKEPNQDLVILVIPSHDKKNRALPEARIGEWATQAMRLFADLYRGATVYETFQGVFKTEDGQYLFDKPKLIESYASHEAIQDPENLTSLVTLAKRMGKDLNQAAVMLVIGRVMYYIEDYSLK